MVSNILLRIYFLVSAVDVLLLFLDIFSNIHLVSDTIFFYILLPATIISGIFGGIHSSRMIIIKLLPWVTALLILIGFSYVYDHSEGAGWIAVGAAVTGILMLIQGILSGLATFLYHKWFAEN